MFWMILSFGFLAVLLIGGAIGEFIEAGGGAKAWAMTILGLLIWPFYATVFVAVTYLIASY